MKKSQKIITASAILAITAIAACTLLAASVTGETALRTVNAREGEFELTVCVPIKAVYFTSDPMTCAETW